MLREYEAQRERNLTDAWTNGGEFEGKRVTDAMLLKHFDDKLKHLDPKDPLYDEAQNTAEQYRFAVRNSKMELGYAQKKIGDHGMAAFYRHEASRHPQNSEAWRNMMKLAAQYQGRANAAGRARSAAASAALNAKIENPQGRELGWDGWRSTILELARRRHIINNSENPDTGNPLSGQGFADLQPASLDYEHLSALIDEFATAPQWSQAREDLTNWIKHNGDPHFDGDFSMAAIGKLRKDKMAGLHDRLNLALRKGTKTQSNKIQKVIGETSKDGAAISVIDPLTHYEEGRKLWNDIQSDPSSTPLDRINADQAWAKTLTGIWREVEGLIPQNTNDGGQTAVVSGRLLGELQGLSGDTGAGDTASMWDEGRPHTEGDTRDPSKSDIGETADRVNSDHDMVNRLLAGTSVLTQVGSDLLPTDKPGSVWGVVDKATMDAAAPAGAVAYYHHDPYGKLNTVNLDANGNPTSGQLDVSTIMSATVGQPVNVVGEGTLDAAGRPTETLDPAPGTRPDIGMAFVFPDGTRTYSYIDASGATKYTPTPWWKTSMEDGSKVVVNDATGQGGGIQLKFSMPTGKTYNPYDVERTGHVAGAGGINQVFNPTEVIEGWHFNPALSQWDQDTFDSNYVARIVSNNTIATLDPKLIAQGIGVESGGDEVKAAKLMAEADTAKARGIQNMYDYVPNARLQRGNYLPEMSADEKASMPETAAQIAGLQAFETENTIRSRYGQGELNKLRKGGVEMIGNTGFVNNVLPGGLGLASAIRNGVKNTMDSTTEATKNVPIFGASFGTATGPTGQDLANAGIGAIPKATPQYPTGTLNAVARTPVPVAASPTPLGPPAPEKPPKDPPKVVTPPPPPVPRQTYKLRVPGNRYQS